MPMLLEDLAEETSASNQRAADRLDAEARDLHKLEQEAEELQHKLADPAGAGDERRLVEAALQELRQRVVESARQATEYAISRLPQAEAAWRLALVALRKQPKGEDAERLLQSLLAVFESGQRLVRAPREMWEVAQQVGATPERLEELDGAEEHFKKLAREARQALEHRTRGWQPADPERLALGLQLAREGNTVKAEEARARFRRTGG
jgi:hypothetical protein